MSMTIDMVKCACADCVCVVNTDGAIMADGRAFCSDNCAGHHAQASGCEHAGCPCHG